MNRTRNLKNNITDGIIAAVLVIAAIASLIPMINTIAVSFSEKSKAAAGLVYFWPVDFTFASYSKLIKDALFWNSFVISIKRVILGVGVGMSLTVIMAYPLSKDVKAFRTRNIYMWIMVFTMLFNGGLIPWYMTVRTVGLLDKIWALILPGAVNVYNVILMMNFFKGVPKELEEAATIDRAGPLYVMLKIYLPVSLPAVATITLFTIVFHWNSFFDGLVLMNRNTNFPMQTYIQQLIVVIDPKTVSNPKDLERLMKISNKTFNAAKVVVSMLPILMIYPFLQRYFVTGLVLGSVKE